MAKQLSKQQQQEVDRQVKHRVEQAKKDLERIIEERVKTRIQNTQKKVVFVKTEFKKQTSTAIIAAFSFLIALVWRDLISKIIQENATLQSATYPVLAELITALIITVIAVFGIILTTRWAKTEEETK